MGLFNKYRVPHRLKYYEVLLFVLIALQELLYSASESDLEASKTNRKNVSVTPLLSSTEIHRIVSTRANENAIRSRREADDYKDEVLQPSHVKNADDEYDDEDDESTSHDITEKPSSEVEEEDEKDHDPNYMAEAEKRWMLYKQTHKKVYNQIEEEKHKLVWLQRDKMIHLSNKLTQRNLQEHPDDQPMMLGHNHLTDLSEEDLRKLAGYEKPSQLRKQHPPSSRNANTRVQRSANPKSIDYRRIKTRVRNQLLCGCCWAMTANGVLEYKNAENFYLELSVQELIDCDTISYGCGGGHMDDAFQYISNRGIMAERDYPYKAQGGTCSRTSRPSSINMSNWIYTKRPSVDDIKDALVRYGPVGGAMFSQIDSLVAYKSGIYADQKCNKGRLDHAVLIVGYDVSANGVPYWIIKNSWGEDWGLNGYLHLRMGYCLIEKEITYVIGNVSINQNILKEGKQDPVENNAQKLQHPYIFFPIIFELINFLK